MIPCPACKRHLRTHETRCPFCAASLAGSETQAGPGAGAFTFVAVVCLSLVACSGREPSSGDDGQTTTTQGGDETTTDDPTTTDDATETSTDPGTETDTNDTAETDASSGGSFYAGPDPDFSPALFCDPWEQDCPEGEKCVPYASTGSTWDANKCVPILGDDQAGEPCSSDGLIWATDTCDGDSVCWQLMEVDGQLLGTCASFCAGSPEQPECAAEQACVIANEGSVNLCLASCDPLAQDCGEGLGCYPSAGSFVCTPAAETGIGEACDQGPGCQPGSVCLLAEVLPECAGEACCAQLCSLTEPSCEQPGTACVPYYESNPPAGLDDVGVCVGPG